MKYYVTSDVHGFYTPLRTSLTKAGYFDDAEPHKLLIVGDLFDRGGEAVELQGFILDLLLGDPSKAERVLGWKRKVTFPELVRRMVKYDLELFKKDILIRDAGYTVTSALEEA